MSAELRAVPDPAGLPDRIGARYRVLEQLGRGGMAVVYRVRDRSASHDVALKQLLAAPNSGNHRSTELFEREFYVLAQLKHPSVIAVYDYGINEVGPYYTMELLDGGDLSTLAPLPFASACQLMMQVCSSLSLLHSRRLLHRDVSPRNVRCTRAGEAKLIDFGAMVPMGPCSLSVGTPAFMAPEVVHHLNLDARTDLFSVGATLYFALTGRRPFPVRAMAELNEAWRIEPTPPSRIVAGIPAALDELVLSLMRIDPARRPRSAFEVMQRLAAIAGVDHTESDDISRAYLSTPTLVGREVSQRRFRQCLRRTSQGPGLSVLFEGEAGVGRTRLLDVCVLEAKTAGASVLQLDGSTARQEPFASAHRLAEKLLQLDPDSPARDLADPKLTETLFEVPTRGQGARLLGRERMQTNPEPSQAALLAWIQNFCRQQLLMIAVDDIERIDDASLAVLVALIDSAADCRLLVVATTTLARDEQRQPALALLRTQSTALTLDPLTVADMEALFASIFFDAPHSAVVSHRVHQLASGRPREAMALVQHLVDVRKVLYTDGNWILPAELGLDDLPASAEEALRLRIDGLPPLPRKLAELHALSLHAAWTRTDYVALVASASEEQLTHALAQLMSQGILVGDGNSFALSRMGVTNYLIEQLSAEAAREQHATLADVSAKTDKPWLFEVHHALKAEQALRALGRLAPILNDGWTIASIADASGLMRGVVASIIEHAHFVAVSNQRHPREINELRRLLVESSSRTDEALLHRYGPLWFSQLEHDSGLLDYRTSADDGTGTARLQASIARARARFAATPASQRVYDADEALKHVARYVTFASATGWRTADTKLLASFPPLLEPLADLSPFMYCIWQNSLAVLEITTTGQLERGRRRYLDIYERLKQLSNRDADYVEIFRHAIVGGICQIEVMLGYPSAGHWLDLSAKSPLHQVNMRFLRRVLCIFEGDVQSAERLRHEAEVLAVQAAHRQVFGISLIVELQAQVHAGDLAGVKQVAERAARQAASAPRWLPFQYTAQGYFQQLRGDLIAAKAAFERALDLSSPDREGPPPMLRAWVAAVAGYISVLTELGQAAEACRFGVAAVERCEALEITDGFAHIRALALAEAKAGHYASAAARLDRVIAQRAGMNPALVAKDLEARALVAIWARDRAAAAHFCRLALHQARPDSSALLRARRGRLLEEASRAGLALEVPATGIESIVLGAVERQAGPQLDPQLLAALDSLRVRETRANRTLELLCASAHSVDGQLYWWNAGAFTRCAAQGAAFDAALDEFVLGYFNHQLEQAAMTTIFTATEASVVASEFAVWTSPVGELLCVALIGASRGKQCVGAVAFRHPASGTRSPDFKALLAAVADRLTELQTTPEALPGRP